MMSATFSKTERLCSHLLIDELFAAGSTFMVFPYSVRYLVHDADRLPSPAQVLVGVSKRRFHHAVDRNRVKRLTRECYRQRKAILYEALQQHGKTMTFSLNYVGNTIMDHAHLSRRMDKVVETLVAKTQN